jgi:hypothetical protein
MDKKKVIKSVILIIAVFVFCYSLVLFFNSTSTTTTKGSSKAELSEKAVEFFGNSNKALVSDAPVPKDKNTTVTQSEIRSSSDGTDITTTYDSYGAKIQMRRFPNDPRLAMVIVETHPDGKVVSYAYSMKNEIRNVPSDMISSALSDSADRISDSLGFVAPIKQSETVNIAQPPQSTNESPTTVTQTVLEPPTEKEKEKQEELKEEPKKPE